MNRHPHEVGRRADETTVATDASSWFARRTWQVPPWSTDELVVAKRGRRIAVVLPALNEEATVAGVVAALRPEPDAPAPLVDDLVVLDSGSTDRTAERARAAGARVVSREQALPGVEVRPGKGEVLWRALGAIDADVVVYVDSDLVETPPGLVEALVGPILTAPGVQLVKGFYRRPLRIGGDEHTSGGGRVTELAARPLLGALFPELSLVVQPLGGEYAATTELLRSLPFAAGYGVEIGLLIDVARTRGLDAVAQVDVGVRKHRNRSLLELGRMSRQITGTVLGRAGIDDPGAPLVQFRQGAEGWQPVPGPVDLRSRLPFDELDRA